MPYWYFRVLPRRAETVPTGISFQENILPGDTCGMEESFRLLLYKISAASLFLYPKLRFLFSAGIKRLPADFGTVPPLPQEKDPPAPFSFVLPAYFLETVSTQTLHIMFHPYSSVRMLRNLPAGILWLLQATAAYMRFRPHEFLQQKNALLPRLLPESSNGLPPQASQIEPVSRRHLHSRFLPPLLYSFFRRRC